MRRVAAELDTAPASLYVCVDGSRGLRDAKFERVVGSITLGARADLVGPNHERSRPTATDPLRADGCLREGNLTKRRRVRLLEKLAEIVPVNSGVGQDPSER